jgi:hypothetical protein
MPNYYRSAAPAMEMSIIVHPKFESTQNARLDVGISALPARAGRTCVLAGSSFKKALIIKSTPFLTPVHNLLRLPRYKHAHGTTQKMAWMRFI